MNQIKIERFIAERRKKANLTQMQLADKLGITDKAVSKWERGVAMPDTSIMLELCELLDISVNELLSGEKMDMEIKYQQNEQLLLDLAKELEDKNKKVWTSMWMILILSTIALLAGITTSIFLIPKGIWTLITVLLSCVVFVIPCYYALKLEISVGAYKCKNCGHEIVPTYKEAMMAMHRGTTRHLKCPKCGKRTWCKKIMK